MATSRPTAGPEPASNTDLSHCGSVRADLAGKLAVSGMAEQ
jgi:hypothetical protein